jgi:hypothetical protein
LVTDLPIYRVSENACVGFDRNYDQFILPLLPITEVTLANIECQLTRDEWEIFFDQLNIAVQKLALDLRSHFLLRRDSHYIDNIVISRQK